MTTLTILDGGMGRELKRIGAPFSQPLWSAQALIEATDAVQQAHQNFIAAGAEIITANSYACVPFHLGQERFDQQGATLAQTAAKIARDTADKATHTVKVAASLPPALGSYRPDLFEENKARVILETLYQAQAPYVDLWLAETISSLAEVDVILDVVKGSDKPVYLSFSLRDDTEQSPALRSGEPLVDVVERLSQQRIDGVFFNCSIPEVIAPAIEAIKDEIKSLPTTPIIGVFANSFSPIRAGHQANGTLQEMRAVSPAEHLEYAQLWYQLGARVIGGCCGIGPEHIKVISDWKQTLNNS
ncbi:MULTISPECIES: homocysteine S-methyltransferase family protein [unclassified Vibrio]|uniref:Homocysteine S-methyltransferase family protein n=1 Tax=Vibrio sp. HB236076 TaxID=3232307 RepID=A0AB39HBI6_9VIBR|nr:homocysteine S-methyltransferase family protein [Vibrio sp. HB161653]MDP5254487.1 homocysteine S-methyltransferase family protein [Vibrio sp. HB161653]